MSDILQSAWDLHFHTAPDVSPRKCTDLELAKDWMSAGMKGGVIKNHYLDTSGRAKILTDLFPGLTVKGGLVLNKSVGGINPDAVLRMAQAGGSFLWFPTLDALEYQKYHHRDNPTADLSTFISVCDEDGKLLPSVYDVLDIAAEYDLVVGTGHLGEKEGKPLVKEAFRRGVKRIVLTHAENPATKFSLEAQAECVKLGAMVEYSYFTLYWNRVTVEEMIEQIRKVGIESCILVTDFGQSKSPVSSDGLRQFAETLQEHGMKEQEVVYMLRQSPTMLMT